MLTLIFEAQTDIIRSMKKIPVGILGATGMVGQRFVTLLQNHPWFEVVAVAASPRSVGKTIANLTVQAVEDDMKKIAKQVRLVFSALDMSKADIKKIEDTYASLDVGVVSNNSAHRWTEDVPMVMPEINPGHLELIKIQQKNHGWKKGFIVVKPNCSIQSYVPLLTPLLKYGIKNVQVTTLQAVSGAGKTLKGWPEMIDNVIPFIEGEEEKSQLEPLKIWEGLGPKISATCIRVPLEDGHMASIAVSFKKKVSKIQIINEWKKFDPLKKLNLPSSPEHFITYFEEEDRPQTRIDRNLEKGMGIAAGRLREDQNGFKFIGLSHNTIRGAAGGAILTAELLKIKGYLNG